MTIQTFLLSTSFEQSAKWLDTRRLGKQRSECYQILRALTDPDYGWQNHPCVKMWQGYEWELCAYGILICNEWIDRGYKDSCERKIMEVSYLVHPHFGESALDNAIFDMISGRYGIWELFIQPSWLTESFASNHRSILLGKSQKAVNNLSSRLLEHQELRDAFTIGSIEEISLTKTVNKLQRKLQKAYDTLDWYRQWNWEEMPAKQIEKDGRLVWPYLWPYLEKG